MTDDQNEIDSFLPVVLCLVFSVSLLLKRRRLHLGVWCFPLSLFLLLNIMNVGWSRRRPRADTPWYKG